MQDLEHSEDEEGDWMASVVPSDSNPKVEDLW